MKIMTMKEWAVFQEGKDLQCFYSSDNKCKPYYLNKECIDCYGEYVESMLPKCDVKVLVKEGKKNAKDY